MKKQLEKESQLALWANVEIVQRDAKGRYLSRQRVRNRVVAVGRSMMRDLMGGLPSGYPTHIALGTGTTAVQDSDTALVASVYSDFITTRVQLTDAIKFQLSIPTSLGNGYDYAEAGLNVIANMTTRLFARITFTPVSKTIASSLTVSWTISLSSI